MNGRERVLAHLNGEPVDCLPLMPITMMFAADRIGVKYRDYVTDHRVLVEGQIRTAEEFDLDYVSCISDPAREATDCGARVLMPEDQPPALDEGAPRLANPSDLAGLEVPDPLGEGRMHDRVKAAALFHERVGGTKLIEGWIEGPCAEAADLRGINNLMMDCVDNPGFVRDLFEFVVEMEIRFARAQIDAGVEIMGIGDAAASLVGPRIYSELVWPCEKRLVEGVQAAGGLVRLHICGNTRALLEGMGKLGCEIVDLDFLAPVREGREKMGESQVLLGNIDPVRVLRNGTPESVTAAIAECHRDAGERYIVGAGCEIVRDTPLENVRALCRYAKTTKPG